MRKKQTFQSNGFLKAYYKTRNTKKRTTEHGTQAEDRKTGGTPERWQNMQLNTGRTIGIPRNSGTCEEQRNNVTTKHH